MWRAVAVALVLLVPLAGAADVRLAYDAQRQPFLVAAGAVSIEGEAQGGLLAIGIRNATLGPIPRITLVSGGENGTATRNRTWEDATLTFQEGGLVWLIENASLGVSLASPYAVIVTLPGSEGGPREEGAGSPPPEEDPTGGRSYLSGSVGYEGTLRWRGERAEILPFSAVVAIEGERLSLNEGMAPGELGLGEGDGQGAPRGQLLVLEGAFDALWRSEAVGLAPGKDDADLTFHVEEAERDRFAEVVESLTRTASAMSGEESKPDETLATLDQVSGALNGAVLLVNVPQDGSPVEPTEAALDGGALDPGFFTLLRGADMDLSWEGGTFLASGGSRTVVTQDGLATGAPWIAKLLPWIAGILWLGAIVSMIAFFVKRPTKEKAPRRLRIIAFAAHVLAILVAFVLWDLAFQRAFGLSVLRMLGEGVDTSNFVFPAVVLAIEIVPWTIALLLFALPVRILAGVILRYRPGVKGLKGFAKAAGLVALGILGPFAALSMLSWIVDLAIERVPAMIGG